jgi:hypothetical protein
LANKIAIDAHDHLIGFSPNIQEDSSNAYLHSLAYKYLSDGYAVIYTAESTTDSYSPAIEGQDITPRKQQGDDDNKHRQQEILKTFVTHLRTDKIKRYFQKGLLAIVDPDTVLPSDVGTKQVLDSMARYVERFEAKLARSVKIKGKVLINAPDNFFEAQEFDKFLKFENKLGTKFDDNFSMACWYRKKWTQGLSFSQIMYLMAAHNRAIHKKSEFQMLNVDNALDIISKGIDKAVEQENASTIILEVMQRRFNLTRSKIVSSPDFFV